MRMIKMAAIWLYLFMKRLLCRKAFIGFLLLLPLLAITVRGINTYTNRSSVQLGIVLSKESELALDAAKYLTGIKGAVSFTSYENEEQMKRDIELQKIQWGYAFTDDMEESILRGDGSRSIICYETPASFLSKLTDELVFSAIIRQYGETVLMDYTKNSKLLNQNQMQAAKQELPKAYKSYRDGSDTFSFEYKTLDGKTDQSKGIAAPIRGICAILILIGGIYGAIMLIENERLGLYKRLSAKGKAAGRLAAIYAPTLLLSVSAYLTLLLTGGSYGVFRECIALLIYAFAVGGFCYLLAMIFYNENVICGTIPILTMASLLCCPIFFDASSFLPILATVAKLFLPYYYLKGILTPLFCTAILCILAGIYLSKRRS